MSKHREAVSTASAPAAVGPYSQANVVGNFVFTSGQIPIDPVSRTVVQGDIREQTRQVMDNLRAVLDASGSSLANVVRTTCFLQDMNDFADFNAIYGAYFDDEPPARSTVQVGRLPLDVRIEIDCLALID